MSYPKQIIAIRKDLRNTKGEKVRTGKLMAQVAHASMGSILNYVDKRYGKSILDIDKLPEHVQAWLYGSFTKVCVYVNSEQELLDLRDEATSKNINVKLITDNGLTEFGGILTHTCLALGPDYPEVLDPLTRHFSLV